MKSKYDKNEKNESSEKDKTRTKVMNESKLNEETAPNEIKRSSFWTKSANNQNGLLCPKSVRNNLKKSEIDKEKHPGCADSDKNVKDGSKSTKEESPTKCIIKPITKISGHQNVSISKINDETVDLPLNHIKQTNTKPSLIYSYNPSMIVQTVSCDNAKHVSKSKKKKKHTKSKVQGVSDNECNDSLKKMKKSRKSKKKKNKDTDAVNLQLDNDVKKESSENLTETKNAELPKSFLVSYSSDEDDANVESVLVKKSPEIKLELKVKSTESINKLENKIEIKLKPTKSPGKSTWESSESEMETESKKMPILQIKSPNVVSISPQFKKSNSLNKSVKSKSHSLTASHSSSRSASHNSSYTTSRSGSYSKYSGRSSRSYSRSRSYSKSKRHARRRRHYSSSSSSYSRSRSNYHSRSSSRSTSYSRSSRSYTRSRSRSRYKCSYSSRYRSRSRSHSSRSRSNSYYRSSYRKRKRSSSTNRFLNVPTRKVKAAPIRNSVLQGGPQRHVDIGKKIDAIKESQRKAQNNDSVSNLNIPLPPEKPKGTLFKTGDSYSTVDLSGPVAKKSKKTVPGIKVNSDVKIGDKVDNNQLQFLQPVDYNYIGPQVSSDMAKKLGLDVKSNNVKKDKMKDNVKIEPITSDSFVAPTLDAAHIALQSRAYQHRLYNLQGSTSQDVAAQYYHPLYMSASSLSNNLTAIASAAVANEQLPASVAGSLAQAAVQRIMSSSNLTATYNTPSVIASPSPATLQTAFQHGIPSQCGTLMANTPSGLIPISLLQQGGFQVGINPLVLQQLQQQALSAQFGQAISMPSQHIVNQLLLQASNQHALLQSLGVNAQAQLLGSPLNFQHTLLMAAQQQQQQQLFAAAQINQATLHAAHLQAQIQAQARAVSIQNLQQAAQMQSSAQNAAVVSMANSGNLSDGNHVEATLQQKQENNDQSTAVAEKTNLEDPYIYLDQHMSYGDNNNLLALSTDISTIETAKDQSNIISAHDVHFEPIQSAPDYDNIGNYNSALKQVPRIIYNSASVIDNVDISSPVSKS